MRISFYLIFIVLLFGCFHSESDDTSPNPNPEPTPCELDPQSSPSCEGYVKPEPTPCELDPQSSPSCMGYVEPIDPCDLDPQSSPSCPGYIEPIDPCDLDPQSSPTCTGYVEPCVLDPLSSTSCTGYSEALRRKRSSQWVKHFIPGLEKVSKSLFDSKQETVRYRLFENIRDESIPFSAVPEDERIPHYENFGFHETEMRCFASSLLMVVRDEITCLGRGIGDESGENPYFKVFDGTKPGTIADTLGLGENSMSGSYKAYKRVLDEAVADGVSKDAYVISLALEFGDISLIASKDVDFENGPALAHATENVYLPFEDSFDNFINHKDEDLVCETEAGEEYSCREQAIENLRNHPDKIILVTADSINSSFQCSDYSKPDLVISEELSLIQNVCVRFPDAFGSVESEVFLYFSSKGDIISDSSSGTSYGATAVGTLAYMISRTLGLQTGAQAFTVIKSCAVPNEEFLPGELGIVDVECLFQDDGSLKTCDDSSLGLNVNSSCMDIEETVSVLSSMVLPGDIAKLEMTDRYGRNFPVRVKLGGVNFRHDFERPWLVGKNVFSLPLTFGLSGGERVLINSFSFQNDWLSVSHFSGIEDNFFGFRTNGFVRQSGYAIDSFYRGFRVSFLEDFRSAKYRGSEVEGSCHSFSLSFENNLSSTTFLSFEAKISSFQEGKLHLGDSSYRIQKGAKDNSLKMSFSFGF